MRMYDCVNIDAFDMIRWHKDTCVFYGTKNCLQLVNIAALGTSCTAPHKNLLTHCASCVLQVVLAWLLFLPRLPKSSHQGLVGPPVHAQQVQGVHQGPVCLE